MREPSFFVGYATSVPRDIKTFVLSVAIAFFALLACLAVLVSGAADDPGDGRFGDEVIMKGTLRSLPYPVLHVPAGARHPDGRSVMLAGEGKIGAQGQTRDLEGMEVEAQGYLVKRGALDMLLLQPDAGVRLKGPVSALPPPVALGRWRVTGEICDGKCYAGAMRPGTGLAHKACANLCLSGGVPPVFVSVSPVRGAKFMLMADANGNAAPAGIADFVGLPVSIEGDIEQHGQLLILKADWTSAKAE